MTPDTTTDSNTLTDRPVDGARRKLLLGGAAVVGAAALARLAWAQPSAVSIEMPTNFEVTYTDEEWKKRLTPPQYAVLRRAATERPYTSPLNDEHRAGTFSCAGCALDLYASQTKFDSGTGWPSFYQALPKAVIERSDTTQGMRRTEVLCRRCGGHLGHVFDDGPRPTGLRYCMNGLAMNFKAA